MDSIQAATGVGLVKAFVTDNGPHPPETLAEMTLYQLVHSDSNPETVAQLKAVLQSVHGAGQQAIREVFRLTGADDAARKQIVQVLARDFATMLDIERQHHVKD